MELLVLVLGGIIVGVGTVFAMDAWDERRARRSLRQAGRADDLEPGSPVDGPVDELVDTPADDAGVDPVVTRPSAQPIGAADVGAEP